MNNKVKLGRKTHEANAEPRRRINLMMSETNIAKAKKLGNGNVSEGINAALNRRSKPYVER